MLYTVNNSYFRSLFLGNFESWKDAIEWLLNKHKLTARAAAAKTNYEISNVYISEWLKGRVPQYQTAVKFLKHFPREEAIECLKAAGYSVPMDWQSSDPVKKVEFALNGTHDLEDYQIESIKSFLESMRKKE